ncbi:MAG: hypothetical protein ACREJ0_14875 [Geminicoccaceae bacterium]
MALKEEPRQWDQDGLRAARWFSRTGKQPDERPDPLEDQDAFDAFVGSLRGKIQHQLDRALDDRVQVEIANLTRLLGNMPRALVYRNRVFFEMAFDLLAAEHPNLVLVAQLRQALFVAMEQSTGLGKFIATVFGKTPIQTVICGIFSTFLFLFIAILVLDQAHSMLQTLGSPLEQLHPIAQLMQQMPVAQIIVLVMAAFTGAVVSVLARFRHFLDSARTAPLLVYVTVATKPFVSIAFASFIYAIVACGLVTLPGVDLAASGGAYIVWVIGFLSGFSERFVQDFVAQADRIAGAGTLAATSAAPTDPKS